MRRLKPRKDAQQLLERFAAGERPSAVARELGVDRKVLEGWRRDHELEIAAVRRDMLDSVVAAMGAKVETMADVLFSLASDPAEASAIRCRAASAYLERWTALRDSLVTENRVQRLEVLLGVVQAPSAAERAAEAEGGVVDVDVEGGELPPPQEEGR